MAKKATAPAERATDRTGGYSGTPLAKKLGIKEGHRVALLLAPEGFKDTLDGLPDDVWLGHGLRGRRDLDVIVLFVTKRTPLRNRMPKAIEKLAERGGLWIAWPKKASGVETELSDAVVRELGLATGLVDNKVCAISPVWSGLRFVRRLEK